MIYLGIDPGKSGGVAVMEPGGVFLDKMSFVNSTEGDIADYLRQWCAHGDDMFALIEKVGAMPNDGKRQLSTFMQNYGFLRGCLVALQIPYEEITPTKWQRRFRLVRKDKNETSAKKKNRHKAKAQELYPSVPITHATADAILIARCLTEQRQSIDALAAVEELL